ncbi:MAG: hypothetical protein IJV97_03220 [Alphaproteobacteria bacterium]|nr:hypothetical protein [Alphaproteobacteria bacterium]
MKFLNNTHQKSLFILWFVAFVAFCILFFYMLTIFPESISKNSIIMLSLLTLTSVLCCYINKFLSIILWSITLFCLNMYCIIPIIQEDEYVYDTDEYYDIKDHCGNNAICLADMVKRFQNEISGYYQKLEKDSDWKYNFQDWKHDVLRLCQQYNQEYDKQNCLYEYSYQELQILRKIMWQENHKTKQ